MQTKILLRALTYAMLFACLQGTRRADPPEAGTVKTAIEAKLRVDRRQYHPGESVFLQGFLTNSGPTELKLHGVDFARQYAFVHLHIATPKGEDFLYDPYADHPLRSSLTAISPKSFITKLAPAAEKSEFQKGLRLTDGLTGWSSPEHPHGPLSLRATGGLSRSGLNIECPPWPTLRRGRGWAMPRAIRSSCP